MLYVALLAFLTVTIDTPDPAEQWGAWRGPLATGVAPHATPPLHWSEHENVRWKVAIPGKGHSSPVVWNDRVYVTTAIPIGDQLEPAPDLSPGAHDNAPVTHRQRFSVLALRRSDGQRVWQRDLVDALPHERAHVTGSFASASPITDGAHVIAFFGSQGLYALDMEGDVVWSHDLGDMSVKHGHGEGASPALWKDTVVINWDHEGDSFVAAFDKETGERRWRVARDEVTSWSTPIIVPHGDSAQVIVSGSGRAHAYDIESGDVIWECSGLSRNVVASPVSGDGMVFLGSSYEKQALLAIRLEGAAGDLTHSDNLAWMRRRRTPYVPSPVLYDGALYFLHHYQNVMSRVAAVDGKEPKGPFRLGGVGNVYASPVAADGRIYVTDLEGATLVLSAESEPRMLARNVLKESFSASAAIVGEELYLRGESFLYCLGEEP